MAIDPSAVQGLGTDEAATNGAAPAAPADAAPTEPDIWAAFENADPDEVLSRIPAFKRKFDGLVGTHAQRQAQQIAQQQIEAQRGALMAQAQQTATETAENERLKRLHDEDLFTWDQERQKVEQRRQMEAQQRLIQQAPAIAAFRNMVEYDKQVMEPMFRRMPLDAQKRLEGKQYPGDGYESRRAAMEEMMQEIAAENVRQERTAWEKAHAVEMAAIRANARQDTLAEMNGDQPIDTGAGSVSGGVPTPSEWASLSYQQHVAMKKQNPNIEMQIEMAATERGEGVSWEAMKTASGA